MQERCSRNNEEPTTTFLKVPIYRIVSIATLNAKREDGGGPWTVSQIAAADRSARRPRQTYCSASSKPFLWIVAEPARSS